MSHYPEQYAEHYKGQAFRVPPPDEGDLHLKAINQAIKIAKANKATPMNIKPKHMAQAA